MKEFYDIKQQVLNEIENTERSVPYWYICMWLQRNITNDATANISHTTYGLKHDIEDDYRPDGENGFCKNNWVKVAMYDMHYDLVPDVLLDDVVVKHKLRIGTEEMQELSKDYLLDDGTNFFFRLPEFSSTDKMRDNAIECIKNAQRMQNK